MKTWIIECKNKWINWWIWDRGWKNEWMHTWMNEWMNDLTNEFGNELMNEWRNEWMNEWIKSSLSLFSCFESFHRLLNAIILYFAAPVRIRLTGGQTDGGTDGNIDETQTDRQNGWLIHEQRCDLGGEIAHLPSSGTYCGLRECTLKWIRT